MQGFPLRLAILVILFTALFVIGVNGTTVDYIIYPIEDIDIDRISAVDALIKGSAGKDHVYASKRSGQPIPVFWVAPLSEESYEVLRVHPWVCHYLDVSPLGSTAN